MTAPATLDRSDVQGNILQALGYHVVAYVFLEVHDRAAASAWLSRTVPRITTAERRPKGQEKPDAAFTLDVTAAGLRGLGVPAAVMDSFPKTFLEGMAARAGVLGDTGPSDPSRWQPPEAERAHVLLTVHTKTLERHGEEVDRLRAEAAGSGLDVHHVQPAHRLMDGKEHFGFVDGMGQPALDVEESGAPAQGSPPSHWWQRGWQPLPIGEFLHGHPDSDGVPGPAPAAPFDRNGTFVVYRQLQQDVPGFRAHVADQARRRALDEQLVAAKLVGRWTDGTPLVLSSDRPRPEIAADREHVNHFGYRDDADGYDCPIGAHIRRANPRDALGFGASITGRHRMLRRGMPYGRGFDDVPEEERGLIFMAFVADIERQFEFVQAQWCNDGDAFGLGTDGDGLLGGHAGQKMTVQGDPPWFVSPLGRFVTTRAGAYLYKPGLHALRTLAEGGVS